MKTKDQNKSTPILSAFCLAAIIFGWLLIAPQKIGGQSTYIIIIGNSMEPDLEYGDLVLVRDSTDYTIGDIVAYTQPDVGTILHRIISIENGAYTLKGDNNSWEDSYNPCKQEIIGKLWIHIPSAGKYFQKFRTPAIFTSAILFFSIFVLATIFSDNSVTKNNHKLISGTLLAKNKDSGMEIKISDTLYLLLVIAFIALILAIVSFTQPLETSAANNFDYTHHGYFEYFAYVPDDVFEGNILRSGDPIFRQLNDSIDLTFSYELTSDQIMEIQGTFRLLVEINESSGWYRTVEIIPLSHIVENSFTSSGVLDLSEIQTLVDNFEEQTGISNNRYTLSIVPEVIIEGTVGSKPMEDTFSPELKFSFDDAKLLLLNESSDIDDILNPVSNGVVLGSQNEPNSISLLGFSLNVLIARIISVYALVGAAIAFYFIQKKIQPVSDKENNNIEKE